MKSMRLFLYATIFFGALFIGFLSALYIASSTFPDSHPASPISTKTYPDTEQYNILLISTEGINRPTPYLRSIWLAVFNPVTDKITLVPIFPNPEESIQNQFMAAAFQFEKNHRLSHSFTDILQETGIWWNAYLVIESESAKHILDNLDLSEGGKQSEGIFEQLPDWQENPQIAIERQKLVFESLCSQSSRTKRLSSFRFIKSLLTDKIHADLSSFEILQSLHFFTTNQGQIKCEFPTFESQAYLTPDP
jgi:hypothetical protein